MKAEFMAKLRKKVEDDKEWETKLTEGKLSMEDIEKMKADQSGNVDLNTDGSVKKTGKSKKEKSQKGDSKRKRRRKKQKKAQDEKDEV